LSKNLNIGQAKYTKQKKKKKKKKNLKIKKTNYDIYPGGNTMFCNTLLDSSVDTETIAV
jgi:hypothetical protein